ncbi:MAG: glycosyltransferase family 4 protein [Thermoplasmatales archaeon]|nr:glycosyltransferase family 4 protein [Candidatus Thermoplasmatota archaeon]MDA8054456.1 glycosyltransferase family 4 protein [Thermoplasmatales archaeon]
MKICVNSQTPIVRFKLSYEDLLEKYGNLADPLDINSLEEGVDYEFTPGGVTNMLYPAVNSMLEDGFLEKVVWVSLGINYPPRLSKGNLMISHVEVDEKVLRNYTTFKEGLWSEIHGVGKVRFTQEEFNAYATYNWENAKRMFEYIRDIDLFYVQDFQLLVTGTFIGPSAPAVLRWHIPFVPEKMGAFARRIVVKGMESFDAVVVSTRRDLEGLIKSDYRGRAYQLYPYIDPRDWVNPPSSDEVEKLREKIGLKPDEKLVIIVARMDRIKSQDVGIKAFALASKKEKLRLALIGNGSFSSSSKGGLGFGKGAIWRAELEKLVKELGLEGKVVFLGHSPKEELKAAYYLSSAVLLTSSLEGFGITVLEGWTNRKPAVVSSGCGVSELVVNDSNGYVFQAGDFESASEMIVKAIGSAADRLGEYGYESSKQCCLNVAVEREKKIFEEVGKEFKLDQN